MHPVLPVALTYPDKMLNCPVKVSPLTTDPLPMFPIPKFGAAADPGVVKFTVTLPLPVKTRLLTPGDPMVTVPVPLPPMMKSLETLKMAEPAVPPVVLMNATGVLPFCTMPKFPDPSWKALLPVKIVTLPVEVPLKLNPPSGSGTVGKSFVAEYELAPAGLKSKTAEFEPLLGGATPLLQFGPKLKLPVLLVHE